MGKTAPTIVVKQLRRSRSSLPGPQSNQI